MFSTPFDPDAGSVIVNTAREVLSSVLPGGRRDS
jgi:hypothetical protein